LLPQLTAAEIIADLPDLDEEDIRQAQAYASVTKGLGLG
jgi:uncharacterized protein (DUF433 family)